MARSVTPAACCLRQNWIDRCALVSVLSLRRISASVISVSPFPAQA